MCCKSPSLFTKNINEAFHNCNNERQPVLDVMDYNYHNTLYFGGE